MSDNIQNMKGPCLYGRNVAGGYSVANGCGHSVRGAISCYKRPNIAWTLSGTWAAGETKFISDPPYYGCSVTTDEGKIASEDTPESADFRTLTTDEAAGLM